MYIGGTVAYQREYLELDDARLLKECEIHIYKASGPGGQHRNKVSSAVRLAHKATGVTAQANESRSQHNNKRKALSRLRMKIACTHRCELDSLDAPLPEIVSECMFVRRGKGPNAGKTRLEVGRKDHRFWLVAAFLLDVLDAHEGKLSDATAHIGISTGNMVSLLKTDRHLLTAAQYLRKAHDLKPLT